MNERQDVGGSAGTTPARPGATTPREAGDLDVPTLDTPIAAQADTGPGTRPEDTRDPSTGRPRGRDGQSSPESEPSGSATRSPLPPSDDPRRGRNGQDDSVAESIGRAISAPIRTGR